MSFMFLIALRKSFQSENAPRKTHSDMSGESCIISIHGKVVIEGDLVDDVFYARCKAIPQDLLMAPISFSQVDRKKNEVGDEAL